MLGGDQVVKSLSGMLSRALPAAVATVRAQDGVDETRLPEFRAVYENMVDVLALDAFPVVMIEILQTEGEISNSFSQTDVIVESWGITYEVALHVLCTSTDEGVAAEQARRLLLAVRLAVLRNKVLLETPTESLTVAPQTMQEEYYELLQNSRSTGYLGGGGFRVKIRATEEFDPRDPGEVLHPVRILQRVSKVPRDAALDAVLDPALVGEITQVPDPAQPSTDRG